MYLSIRHHWNTVLQLIVGSSLFRIDPGVVIACKRARLCLCAQ